MLLYKIFIYLAIFFISLGMPQSQATVYYVSPSGRDADPGTFHLPFKTLSPACSGLLRPGDIVIVEDGIYNITGSHDACDLIGSGTPTAWITFISQHLGGAKLSGENNTGAIGFYFNTNAFIRIRDFEIYGFSHAAISIENKASTNPSHHIEISANDIHDIGKACSDSDYGLSGIFIGHYSYSILIDRNMIHAIGRLAPGQQGCKSATHYYENHDHGIYLDGVDKVTIFNNTFYGNNRGWDIQFWNDDGTPVSRHVLIANNTFESHNPYQTGQIILGYPGVKDSSIENNTFDWPPASGIWIYNQGNPVFSNVEISDNKIHGGHLVSGGAPGISYVNNSDSP